MKLLSTFLVLTVCFAFANMKAPSSVKNIKEAIKHTEMLKK